MNDLKTYKGLGYNAFLIMGAISTYISAVMPIISESLSLSYTQVGTIFAANSMGFLLGALLIGTLIDYVGTKKPLLIAGVAFPLGVVLFALAKTEPMLILGNMIIGFGVSSLEVAIPPISGKFRGESGKLLNLIHAFFALGSMISPLIASFFIAKDLPYTAFFFVIAGYTCIPLYFTTRLTIHIQPAEKKDLKGQKAYAFEILKNKYFWIIFTAIFFYVASEIGVFSWAPLYSTDYLKNNKELSSLLPSIFWVGLLAGRFLSSGFVDRIGHLKWLMIVSITGLPITFFAQFLPSNFVLMAIFLCLSGLIHSSIFPTLQSLLVETIHEGLGFALSLFTVGASFGSLFAGFIIGKISGSLGIQWGYFTPFLLFSGVFVMIMLFVSINRREQSR